MKKRKVKVVYSCPTLWDPMDNVVHRILQTGILEWAVFLSSPVDLPAQESNQGLPALHVDSLPTEL